MALKTVSWIGGSADWGTASDWSNGAVPNSADNVKISTAAVLTVFYSGGDDSIVNSLTVGDDLFDMSGGSLAITTTASFGDGFTQTSGTFSAGGTVTISGTGTFNGYAASEGNTVFDISGEIAMANYTLGGYTHLNNVATTNLTGGITLGDINGSGATINNEKGANFNITGDFGISQGNESAIFINAGSLVKTAGGDSVSYIDVNLTDTGTIVVDAGILDFRGPTDSFKGTISGAGQFALDNINGEGSNDLIAAGTKITTLTFGIYTNNTFVTLGENLSYAGAFYLEDGSTLDLDGHTLTLPGTNTFSFANNNQPTLDGTGESTLVTGSASNTTVSRFVLGGTVDWENSGTVGNVGGMTLGDGTFNTATFTNEKGGLYELSNGSGIAPGAALNSSFVNDVGATFENSGGAFSTVGVDFFNSGAIVIETAGTIDFAGVYNSFAGTISGAGQFMIGANSYVSSSVIGPDTTISASTFTIYSGGTEVTLGGKLSYAGAFNLEQQSILDLNGFALTLSGSNTFFYDNGGEPTIDGGDGSLLVTTKSSTTEINDFVLGGAVDWQNSGTVNEVNNPWTIGDGSFDAATFTNEKGGVYDLLGDIGILSGSVPNSSFINDAGAIFEKRAGTSVSVDSAVGVAFTNNGTVDVAIGTLEFQTTVNGTGKFSIGEGTILQFDSSVAAGSSVDFANKSGADLVLYDSQQFDAGIHGFGGADALYLRDIDWNGSGPTTLSFKYNTGSTTEGVLTVGDSSGHTAHLTLLGTGYATADFQASEDSTGHTMIVDPATHATVLAAAR
jgi:hypothetical protein